MALGENIKKRRKAMGLRQRDVCAMAHVSGGSMSLLENDKRTIKPERLTRIAMALQTNVESLVNGSADEAGPIKADVAKASIYMLPRSLVDHCEKEDLSVKEMLTVLGSWMAFSSSWSTPLDDPDWGKWIACIKTFRS